MTAAPPNQLPPSEPFDWRLYRRMALLVLVPAGLSIGLGFGSGDSPIRNMLVIGMVLVVALVNTALIVRGMQQVGSRLRKTSRALRGELANDSDSLSTIASNQDTLVAAEEELFHVSGQVRSEWAALRDANRHLYQSNTLFEGVLETMHEAVLVVDTMGRMLFINPAASDLFDVPRRQATGRLAWEAIRSGTLQGLVADAFAERRLVRREVEVPRQKRVLDVAAIMLSLEAGQGCLVVAHDVTELRKLERMRRDFVSNVSHELKTPLTSIQAYADTLLDGGLDDETSSRMFVERIVEQSERLNALVQDLLRLAKIESEPDAFQFVRCDVGAIVRACVDDHRQIARSRQLTLTMELPSGELYVRGDRDGLRTILNNLVSNALNYTPSGGRVKLAARNEGGRVLFEVSDTGVGIAREHQSRIFERFYRVDKARTRASGGTGLGLSIVRHLVEVMHGEIKVESELGQGTTFRVWLTADMSA
ncbi:MAG: PAS domain-containing protein [Planctomycetota bacterium]|nr:MAG: PAS domain-containing protein [Planctomycetota bacterium]